MAEGCGGGVKVRRFCTNYRCLFRKTCRKAQEPQEGERVTPFHSPQGDIYCQEYDTMLTEYDLTDHTQEYLERSYKKYCVCKKDVV